MTDHVITRQTDLCECLSSRSMRGAQRNTNHLMQRAILVATVRPPMRKKGMKSKRLNTGSSRTTEIIVVGPVLFGYNISNFYIILVKPVLMAFLLETQLLYT